MTPADRRVAHAFHIQLVSRVATQRLGYGHGAERGALASLQALFEQARRILEPEPDAHAAEVLIWEVMNSRLRPFTAKWHPKSDTPMLDALDASDEFRGELESVQAALSGLDGALRLINDSEGYPSGNRPSPRDAEVDAELSRSVEWRPAGGVVGDPDRPRLVDAEAQAVRLRRAHYDIDERSWAAGIALSGGGIRSATFSIGVLSALARRNLLPQFDYLSTVSGGGYAGSFLTQLLGTSPDADVGLGPDQYPFRRMEGESEVLKALRQRARYLSGSTVERVLVAMRQTHGIFVNLLLILLATSAFAYVDAWVQHGIGGTRGLLVVAVAAPFLAILLLAWLGKDLDPTGGKRRGLQAALGALFVLPPAYFLLSLVQEISRTLMAALPHAVARTYVLGSLPLFLSACAAGAATLTVFSRPRSSTVAVLTAAAVLSTEVLLERFFSMNGDGSDVGWLLAALGAGGSSAAFRT